jgi:hypothetical protein
MVMARCPDIGLKAWALRGLVKASMLVKNKLGTEVREAGQRRGIGVATSAR